MPSRHRARVLALGLLTAVCGAVLWSSLDRGWWPHDEGVLAQSAERVLGGELPHRDYDEVYTGGLTYLNAAAFRLLGTDLRTPRLVMFAVYLAWLPAVAYIASRFVHPLGAALVVLLAALWSVPNYSAAMPSWYNLFFATFGVAALFRHIESGRRRWLVAAGACAGLSCLVKIVGLYFLAAIVLTLVFREQELARRRGGSPATGGRVYSSVITGGLVLFVLGLCALIHERLRGVEFVHFVLPGAVLAALLVWREWAGPGPAVPDGDRLAVLGAMIAPLALGVAVPVALFLVPYAAAGALDDLLHGVFVLPFRRITFASSDAPALPTMAAALPVAALLLVRLPQRARWLASGTLGLLLAGALIVAWRHQLYQLVWYSMRAMVPITVLAGALVLSRRSSRPYRSSRRAEQLMALLAAAALCSLVQFPFAAYIYFLYVAPLALLAAVGVVSMWHRAPHLPGLVLLGFYLGFTIIWVNTAFISTIGDQYERTDQTERLAVARAGLRVSPAHKREYEHLAALVRAHAGGEYIYATPDCPEVYFLAGRKNPTRTLFDFFDEPAGRTARILEALERHDVRLVAINRRPEQSGPAPVDLVTALRDRYPHAALVDGQFEVRWR